MEEIMKRKSETDSRGGGAVNLMTLIAQLAEANVSLQIKPMPKQRTVELLFRRGEFFAAAQLSLLPIQKGWQSAEEQLREEVAKALAELGLHTAGACVYNEGVHCGGGNCGRCAWNPMAEARPPNWRE